MNRLNTLAANDGITITAGARDKERKLKLIVSMTGDARFEDFVWIQDKQEREKFLEKLCAVYAGIGTEEQIKLRDELEAIRKDHELDIDIHPPHPGKMNGRGTCSIDYYVGSRLYLTESGNLIDSRFQRTAAGRIADVALEHLPGRKRSRDKLIDQIQRMLLDEIKRLRHTPAPPARSTYDPEKIPYLAVDGVGMFVLTQTMGGESQKLLANFVARIVANIVRTDGGAEPSREVELAVELRGATRHIVVKTAEFRAMTWALDRLGGEYIIEQGASAADHLRVAIQKLSPEPTVKEIHTHTGWMVRPDKDQKESQ